MECALQLFANEMVEEHEDAKGKKKLVIQKLHNPNTGILYYFDQVFSQMS